MQPLKAEAYVVQNIYQTGNNKRPTDNDLEEFRSKTTNKSGRQRSNKQTTAPRCAGTGRLLGRERDGKEKLRTKKHLG